MSGGEVKQLSFSEGITLSAPSEIGMLFSTITATGIITATATAGHVFGGATNVGGVTIRSSSTSANVFVIQRNGSIQRIISLNEDSGRGKIDVGDGSMVAVSISTPAAGVGQVKVTDGAASGGTANAARDAIVIDSNTNTGIAILSSGATADLGVNMGSNGTPDLCRLRYVIGTGFSLFTNSVSRFTISDTGVVNISQLTASSDVQTDGSKNLVSTSDSRLKIDDGKLLSGLDAINKLIPRYFKWKSDVASGIDIRQLGFYSQEVNPIIPEAAPTVDVLDSEGNVIDKTWGFNGRAIQACLVKAVHELSDRTETLESTVKNLIERIEVLESSKKI